MIPANKKIFDLMGDDIVELSTKNECLKIKIGSYDYKWLEESKARLLKQIDDEKRTEFFFLEWKNRWKSNIKSHILVIINYGKVNLIMLCPK